MRAIDENLTATARSWEPDRYLAALLAAAQHRQALVILAAFLAEIRKVPFTVSDPTLAAIRLQWWRDALEAGTASGHPVADALTELCKTRPIEPGKFSQLIDAEEESWSEARPASERERLAFRLSAEVAGAEINSSHDAFLRTAAGLYAAARAPASLPPPDAATDLATLKRLFPKLSPALRNVFLPLAVVRPHLRALQSGPKESNRLNSGLTPFGRAYRIAQAHLLRRI